MSPMSCLGVMAVFAAAVPGGDDSPAERLIHVRQGWGELGIDSCAHPPGQKGQPIRIGGREYSRGFGHHAPGELLFDLGGEYVRFEAEVGVQDLPGAPGSVVFQVLVDGRKQFDSGVLRSGDPARPISVPIEGAHELRLVVTDAGDGITCDCANWAEVRFIRKPGAAPPPVTSGFEIGRFARVVTSDPARKDGARSTRIQGYRPEDVYLETDLPPRPDGEYEVPVTGGVGCIGLRWFERRLVRGLSLEFEGSLPEPGGVQVECWVGESPYQGAWKPLKGFLQAEGPRWTYVVDRRGLPDPRAGTWKVRWLIPARTGFVVRRPRAFASTPLGEAQLRVEFENAGGSGPVRLGVHDGELVGSADACVTLSGPGPHTFRVRYARPRFHEAVRTVLRLTMGQQRLAIAVDDVLSREAVYVPAHGVFVSRADSALTLAAYKERIAGRKTILRQVREMPDQTLARALARVHRPAQDVLPTLLSLACDNRKFVVHRDGRTEFSPAPDPPQIDPPGRKPYPCVFKPSLGSGRHEGLKRRLKDGWLPAPTVTLVEKDVAYELCTFVAPFDPRPATENPWLNPRPLYVAAFRVSNIGSAPADASLRLQLFSDVHENRLARLDLAGQRCIVTGPGGPVAVGLASAALTTKAGNDGVADWLVTGKLPAGGTADYLLMIPAWAFSPDQFDTPPSVDALYAAFRAYWEGVLAPAMRIEVPEPELADIIRASQVHCLLAARNEDGGRRVAPWIASVSYGPLENESHSVIRGMDYLGHHEFARRSLDFFIARYDPSGFLTTGYTLMGTGWHLWTLGEHYELTRDDEWIRRVAPEVARVCDWIVRQRAKTRPPRDGGPAPIEAGLCPPGVMADWNAFAYYFCLNGYYCAGLRWAGKALVAAGVPDGAKYVEEAARYGREILRAYRQMQEITPVVGLRDGTHVSAYPSQLLPGPTGPYFPGEDGNRSWCYDVELGAHHLVPQGVLPPDAPEVGWMMDHMEDVHFLADGWFDYPAAENEKDWFNLGGFSKVQPYYTRNGEIYAMRDDVRPFLRSYFNTLASLLSLENLSLQEHFHGAGAWNKTHETGYFLQQTRWMFVMERGEELWLARLVPNAWLREGGVIDVRQAPTKFGTVAYRIESHVSQEHMAASIEPPTRSSPGRVVVRFRHPDGKPMRQVLVNGEDHADFDVARECVFLAPVGGRIDVRVNY